MEFSGRSALVTGGSQGIGAATAALLAASGASVTIASRDLIGAETAALKIGTNVKAVGCDVTDPESVEAAVAIAAQATGTVDILVTCAGIVRDDLLFRMCDKDWDAVIRTHLTGTFFAVRAAQRYMVEQRYGRIVVISSTSARGSRGQANYSAAKAGIEGMARTLSIELGRFGITVNCIAPGFVRTAMTEATAERLKLPFDEYVALEEEQTAVGRIGEPEDIAAPIVFLCTESAKYITGQVITVSGAP